VLRHNLHLIFESILARPLYFFSALSVLVALPYFILGPFSYFPNHDLADSHYTRYIANQLKYGLSDMYYWNLFAGAGVDFLANGQRPYDGYAIMFRFLPDWLVVASLRGAHIFLSGYFTWRILHDFTDVSPALAFAGAALVLSAHHALLEFFIGYGMVPYLLWQLPKLAQSRWPVLIGTTALIGLFHGWLSMYHLTVYVVVPLIFLWLLFMARASFIRILATTATFASFALITQIEMLGAMFTNAPSSHRTVRTALEIPLDLSSPYLLVPSAVIMIGLILGGFRQRVLVWSAVSTVAFLGLAAGLSIMKTAIPNIPDVLRAISHQRVTEVVPFALVIGLPIAISVITGTGNMGVVFKQRVRNGAITFCVIAGLLPLAFEVTYAARDWIKWGSYAANFHVATLEDLAKKSSEATEPFRVATIKENGLLPAFAAFYGLETADNYLNMQSGQYYRYWGQVIAPGISRNADWAFEYAHVGSRLGLRTDDDHGLPARAADYFNPKLLALANVRYLITNVPLKDPSLRVVDGTLPDTNWDARSAFGKIWHRLGENFFGRDVILYEIIDSLPRWFLTGAPKIFANDAALFSALDKGDAEAFRQSTWLTETEATKLSGVMPQRSDGTIKAATYSNDVISLVVISATDSVLVVTNNWSPFWRATINGVDVDIAQAYGTFWAVPIPAGTHKVRFRYQPPYAMLNAHASKK
tara:strand:+ start:1970 stop:4069 length:2100 start_codon:yes stop_codon:yes gene_type:complete